MKPSTPSTPRRALRATELVTQLAQLQAWSLQGDGPTLSISKRYDFANFHDVMAFANAVAWLAHQHDHHPELQLSYRQCTVSWRTHDVDGISALDFVCAAAVDALRSPV